MPVMAGMSLYGEFDGVVFGHYRVRPFTSSSSRSLIAADFGTFKICFNALFMRFRPALGSLIRSGLRSTPEVWMGRFGSLMKRTSPVRSTRNT